MTITPGPTDLDLDELRDLDEAATPAPWQIDFAIGDGTHEISAAPDVLLCYCVGTDHDVTLIVKMRNALPRLLAELDRSRSQITAMGQTIAAFPDANNAANIAHARAQRDGYREELAKTRAELARLRATSGCPSCAANACDEHIHLSSAHIGDLTRELADAHLLLKLIRSTLVAATSGKRVSISLEEVAARITDFVDPEANPATTAEPATKPLITARWPRIPGNDTVALHDCGGDPKCCGTPGDHDDAEPADEPKATIRTALGDDWSNLLNDDEPECGHDRAKSDDTECPECGADLAVLDDADATPAQVRP